MVCEELKPFLARLFNQDEIMCEIIQGEVDSGDEPNYDTTEYFEQVKRKQKQ